MGTFGDVSLRPVFILDALHVGSPVQVNGCYVALDASCVPTPSISTGTSTKLHALCVASLYVSARCAVVSRTQLVMEFLGLRSPMRWDATSATCIGTQFTTH